MRKKEKGRAAREVIENPVEFAKALLGHAVWTKQEEILMSVLKHSRTAVKACHASSKTFTASEVALWWITRHQEAIALTTAPTMNQVEQVLWREIRQASNGARIEYPEVSESRSLLPGFHR